VEDEEQGRGSRGAPWLVGKGSSWGAIAGRSCGSSASLHSELDPGRQPVTAPVPTSLMRAGELCHAHSPPRACSVAGGSASEHERE
jgi:hypothetical protein